MNIFKLCDNIFVTDLYGHDSKEMCRVDMVLDCVVDIREAMVTAVFAKEGKVDFVGYKCIT